MTIDSYRRERQQKTIRDKRREISCSMQFPDCPKQPNMEDCKKCSLWGNKNEVGL